MGFSFLHLTSDQVVGTDFVVTLCNAIGAIFFWATCITMMYSIVALSCRSSGLKSDELLKVRRSRRNICSASSLRSPLMSTPSYTRHRQHLKTFKFFSVVCFLFVFCANALTFVMLLGKSYQQVCAPAYYILTGTCIVGIQQVVRVYGNMMIKTMEAVNKGKTEGPIYQQIQKFKFLVATVVKRATLNVVVNVIFAAVPWLHTKAAYQLPFQWAIGQVSVF